MPLYLITCVYAVAISNSALACGAGDCQADAESFLQVISAVPSTAPEGAAQQPMSNRICMQMAQGCTGSSFVAHMVRDLINLHGVNAWMPIKEFLNDYNGRNLHSDQIVGNTYCTDLDGKEHKWTKNGQQRLQAAWGVLNGNVTCQARLEDYFHQMAPTILFFDGHLRQNMVDAIPFLRTLGASRASVYGLQKPNALEHLVCQVRDCFETEGSYPLFANGTKSDLCMKRRKLDLPDSEYKVYLDPTRILGHLERFDDPWEKPDLKNVLDVNGFARFVIANVDDLTEYEFDNSTAALNGSADEFAKILRSMGIDANTELIKKHLNSAGRGIRTRHNVTAEIFNVEAVRQALVGSKYHGVV